MWKLEQTTFVTNNDRVFEKYKDKTSVILLDTYEERVANDFKTIDLSVVDGFMPHIS